jgi:putative ABC transport system permease protein
MMRMSVVTRGVKNAFRNWLRTLAVVLILAIGIGLSLSMLVANEAVNAKINDLKARVGTTLTINPAGAKGFEGGGEPLTMADLLTVQGIAHVSSASATTKFRLENQDNPTDIVVHSDGDTVENRKTNLKSPTDVGTLGRRNNPKFTNMPANFSMPIMCAGSIGYTDLGDAYKITSGRNLNTADTGNIAIVGKALAEKNNLSVGGTFSAFSQTFTVVGIFDQGNEFENATLSIPLTTAQTLLGNGTDIDTITATIDSTDNVASTQAAIKNTLGASKADVSSPDSSVQTAIDSLRGVQQISIIAFVGALVAAAVIIFLIMMMIVRERKREIGVLKAIGGSNKTIVSQFIVESLVLVLLGTVVGFGVTLFSSGSIANALVSSNTTSDSTAQPEGPRGSSMRPLRLEGDSRLQNSTELIGQVAANVGWTTVAYGLLAAIGIAVVGSAVPAWLISKVRPAIVLRGE